MLMEKGEAYFLLIQGLQQAGRMKSAKKDMDAQQKKAANNMLARGWCEKVQQESDYTYIVESESEPGTFYTVVPPETFCSCPFNGQGYVCKHLRLISLCQSSKRANWPSLDIMTEKLCQDIEEKELCQIMSDHEIFVSSATTEEVYHANILTQTCSCFTYSVKNNCACLMLGHKLLGSAGSQEMCNESTVDEHMELHQPTSSVETANHRNEMMASLIFMHDQIACLPQKHSIPNNIREKVKELEADIIQLTKDKSTFPKKQKRQT